ncbi:hypothetical protein H1D32_15315 [Anaerobacillus sp. CMMVII]|uniref:hypothetical protein n=1 Tax=Anaerobacillus sp. CMMVII TaxID=2755588 RepID=UPI0021B81EA4|nr:hypothetical protein [Anaerobacillus sp. CMMVII]MCT8138960.1 hypothetical protein [Anaerobacillus sp. CMMVII]
MPLFSRLFELPFFESLLPDRLKPVKDEYISDQYSQALISETEKLIEDIIQLSEMERTNRLFKRKTPQYKILLKIKKKRMRLDFSDQKGSDAPIKKRMIIDIYRKIYKQITVLVRLLKRRFTTLTKAIPMFVLSSAPLICKEFYIN